MILPAEVASTSSLTCTEFEIFSVNTKHWIFCGESTNNLHQKIDILLNLAQGGFRPSDPRMDRQVKISPGMGLVLTILYFEERPFRCLNIYIYNIYH